MKTLDVFPILVVLIVGRCAGIAVKLAKLDLQAKGSDMIPSKIYYLASDLNRPSGGEKHTYEHVNILNDAGIDAYVLHSKPRYRHTWFENDTRVIDYQSFWKIYDMERDYVVVPEVVGIRGLNLPGRKVIFNKNIYHGFRAFGQDEDSSCLYTDSTVRAVLCVSIHNLTHLQFSFPRARVFRMYFHIDCNIFRFTQLTAKKHVIACVAKEKGQIAVLRQILMSRSRAGLSPLQNFRWVFLEGHHQQEVATILQDALITISLCGQEGLGRTLLEAMACGSLVLGVGVGALKESLPVECQFEPENFVAMAQRIEQITSGFPENAEQWAASTEKGRKVAETYTRERQREHLLEAWNQILEIGVTQNVDAIRPSRERIPLMQLDS